MNFENSEAAEMETSPSTIKYRVLLYVSVFFILYSIYTYDSFSTWKFFAVFLPLAFSFPEYKKIWAILPVVVIIWFGFMLMSVGTIYNHDLLSLTGPLVCPEGYNAEVGTLVQNPVPGETYTSSYMKCVNSEGKTINPDFSPHFILLGLYLIPALLLFFMNLIFFRIMKLFITNTYIRYLAGSSLYCYLVYLLWDKQDQIISAVKNLLS